MIEIILDLKDIKNEYDLFRYAYKKLIGIEMPETSERGAVWDAFRDDFADLFKPEIPNDYKFSLDDDWGWSDYNDYLIYKETDKEIGNKNEEGVRDDLKLILVNFYDFYYKYSGIAEYFIHVVLKTYSSAKNNQWNDPVLGFELDIKS